MTLARQSVLARACGVALAVCTPVALVAIGSPAQSSTISAAARGTGKPVSVGLRFVTLNTEGPNSTGQALSDVKKIAAAGADIITLQEMASAERRKAVRAALVDCSGCRYGAWMPSLPVPGSTPILYRKDKFELKDAGTVQVSEATYVGARGAGPSTLNAKYINWVKLREETTGRHFFVLNNHAVPTVQAKNGGPNYSLPKRLALYRKHMNGLKSLITQFEARRKPVFVTGDFNVNYRKDSVVRSSLFPYVNMGQVGVQASYKALGQPIHGTHVLPNGDEKRLIDYVMFSNHQAVKPVANRVLFGYNSDHRPLQVDFTLTSVG
jgi:endonuclease/exonuclease/phosphatase (EEP) superfamily protein YafD